MMLFIMLLNISISHTFWSFDHKKLWKKRKKCERNVSMHISKTNY